MTRTFPMSLLMWLLPVSLAVAQPSPSYFRDVKPLLARYCEECHNPTRLKGGLDLQSFKGLAAGSKKGPAFEPGKPDESRLVLLVEGKEKPVMPPDKHPKPRADEWKTVRAWVAAGAKDDTGTQTVTLPEIKPRSLLPTPVTALAYRPDGKLLAAPAQGMILLIEPANGLVVGSIGGQAERVTALAFTPDGRRLAVASGSASKAGAIRLYSISLESPPAVQLEKSIPAHKDLIQGLAFSPDGKVLASCSYDRVVKLWNAADGRELHTLKDHSDSVYGVAFNGDGTLLASVAADRAVKVWDVATGTRLYTLGDATDWLYTVAWSHKGNLLAAGGVDRIIRVWEANRNGGKIVRTAFGHEAAVLRLVFSNDDASLYSLGGDGVCKAWDAAKMTERRIYEKQAAAVALAISPDHKQLALGRLDGTLVLVEEAGGKVLSQPLPAKPTDLFPIVREIEPNDTPGTARKVALPVTIVGAMDQAGDVDYFRIEVGAGEQVGVQAITTALGSKLEPVLMLLDSHGRAVAESSNGLLGCTCSAAGLYTLGIRDRDYRGGANMSYRLHVGPIPIVTSIFPLGLQRGTETDVAVHGVYLGDIKSVRVKAPPDAPVGTRLPVVIGTPHGSPLGSPTVVVGEYPEATHHDDKALTTPVTCNGVLRNEKSSEAWHFQAKKGQRLVVEVEARRLGSPLDSFIEVLDAKGQPVPRVVLRCRARTYTTFRDHDSANAGIRIESWTELAMNDYLYVDGELLKIDELPRNPDDDCRFVAFAGKRLGFLDTTPSYHSNGTPMYKVSIHPPGTTFPPNGLPVFTLYYQNDDGGPGYGKDSRLFFDPPADGEYQVRIRDTRGQGGDTYAYRLTIRPPRPGYNVRFAPTAPALSKGGAIPISVTAERLDGFDGPIEMRLENLPSGLSAPPTTVPAGQTSTAFALFADATAPPPGKAPIKLVARAKVDGKEVVREAIGGVPVLQEPGDIVTTTEQSEVTVQPGKETRLTVRIERRKGFAGRVPVEVRGLPHGVRVLDIGLNGILITERETVRTFVIYAEPWVEPTEHPFVVLAKREGKNTDHAAKSVLLRVRK